MARPRSSSNSSSRSSESGSGSGSDSESGSDSDAHSNPDSEPELVLPSQKRKDLRWLHAGLFKDVKGATRDVWYSFKTNRRQRKEMIFAADWRGKSFGNLDAGRWKTDLITWDKHHADKWDRYITSQGTWAYKKVMKGRRHQRSTLLQTWLDPNSRDPFARGKQGNRTLGPPRNVIHSVNDTSLGGRAPTSSRVPFPPRNPVLDPAECYPNTRIPFSAAGIVIGCYKDGNNDPLIVIADFLTSQMACHPRFKSHRNTQNDQVESAFYECGWRINRRTLERANDAMALGAIENAFRSKYWKHNPPLWVDRFKGGKLNRMLKEMRDDMGEDRDTDESESESESESSDSDSPDPNASPEADSDAESSSNEVEDGHDLFFGSAAGPSRQPKAPRRKVATKASGSASGSREVEKRSFKSSAAAEDSSDEDELFLPDNSKLKGKGLARMKRPMPGGKRPSPLPSADKLKNVKRSFHLGSSEPDEGDPAKKPISKPWSVRERVTMNNNSADGRLLGFMAMRKNLERNKEAEGSTKKRIAENTSDEDDEEDTLFIPKSTSYTTSTKRIKSEAPEDPERVVISIEDSDSDSDFEILEEKSTPVGVKIENRDESGPQNNEDNLPGLDQLDLPINAPSALLLSPD